MKELLKKYISLSFEQRLITNTVIGLCFSAALALGKFILGLVTDYTLCAVAAYTLALLLAKAECVIAYRSDGKLGYKKTALIAALALISGVIYTAYMGSALFVERTKSPMTLTKVTLLAFISFVEFGFAVAGILRTNGRDNFCRFIKIINLCVALMSILTTQINLLNFTHTEVASAQNAYSGMGVGVFTMLCALYILLYPKLGIYGKEHGVFTQLEGDFPALPAPDDSVNICLVRSALYGSYIFKAAVGDKTLEGDIIRQKSLLVRMHIALKILCIILSEILIFVWLTGRIIFMLRCICLPQRLDKRLADYGYVRIRDIAAEGK